MKFKIKTNIIRLAKEITPEETTRIIFGKSIDELVRDIQLNADGKYNSLFTNNDSNNRVSPV